MPVNSNGTIHKSSAVGLDSNNRAFRYGDAIFETIRVFDGHIPFWKEHWKRLAGGAKYLRFEMLQSDSFYKNEIHKLCRQAGNWRVRLTIYRSSGGLYTPRTNQTRFLIDADPLAINQFELNTNGLKIDTCDHFSLPSNPAYNWKTANCLFYVLAGLYKQDKQLDDCLLVNDKGHIAEASSSNVFILQNNTLRTPPLRSGCKAGTMRKKIIDLASELDLTIVKKKIKEKHLFEAEEIWLTNAIHGLRWVRKFREQSYQNNVARQMVDKLNEQLLI